jgi:CHAD domain-containing protein
VTLIATQFAQIHMEFADALIACRARAHSKAVHRLRRLSRVTEALLLKVVEDHPGVAELHKHSKKLAKQLKRIRRFAGAVRDLDVHRKIARRLHHRASQSAIPKVRSSLMHEHESLDAELCRRRDSAQRDLKEFLATREVKLERAFENAAASILELRSKGPSMLATAKKWLERTPLPAKDPESLHIYRKRTKAARYLAAMNSGSEAARKLELRLKRTQDAIGNWHDLLLLTQEARHTLGANTTTTLAVKDAREKALKKALRVIRSIHK